MSTSETLQHILKSFKKEQLPAIEKAAQAGDGQAQLTLGVLYANGRGVKLDHGAAVEWLSRAGEQRLPAACTLLGWLYANGQGVPSSPRKALQWYRRAAEEGDVDAQCSLGDLLIASGKSLDADPVEALRWYQSAAQQGHPKAQYMLGKLLAEGTLVEENAEAAFQWLTLAIANGSEPAEKELQILTARVDHGELEGFKQRMMERMQQVH